eukprot:9042688-Pyramimonas_sp.AAC.1
MVRKIARVPKREIENSEQYFKRATRQARAMYRQAGHKSMEIRLLEKICYSVPSFFLDNSWHQ